MRAAAGSVRATACRRRVPIPSITPNREHPIRRLAGDIRADMRVIVIRLAWSCLAPGDVSRRLHVGARAGAMGTHGESLCPPDVRVQLRVDDAMRRPVTSRSLPVVKQARGVNLELGHLPALLTLGSQASCTAGCHASGTFVAVLAVNSDGLGRLASIYRPRRLRTGHLSADLWGWVVTVSRVAELRPRLESPLDTDRAPGCGVRLAGGRQPMQTALLIERGQAPAATVT